LTYLSLVIQKSLSLYGRLIAIGFDGNGGIRTLIGTRATPDTGIRIEHDDEAIVFEKNITRADPDA
jgi:hypothetical protein